MKTIVSVNEISEFEIKPKNELANWRKIVSEEIKTTWGNKKDWVHIVCPVCNRTEHNSAFEKYGFEIFIGNQSSEIFWKSFFEKYRCLFSH